MSTRRSAFRLPRSWTAGLADLACLVLPVDCAGCGRVDAAVCPACRAALRAGPLLVRPPVPGSPPVLAATAYAGPVREVLLAWKDRGRHDVGDAVAAALADVQASAVSALRRCTGEPVLLVPVPSSGAARRRRGQDVVEAATRRAGVVVGEQAPTVAGARRAAEVAPLLRQRRGVRDQAGLGAAERAANLRGALAVADPSRPAGRVCVVVDDVVTTGATLAAAAVALRRAGAAVPLAVVVAATPLRRPGGRPG